MRGLISNPILKKEFRTLLRERRSFLIPALYALVLSLAIVPSLLTDFNGAATDQGVRLGGAVAVIQFLSVVLFAPLLGAGGISGERERGTFTRLLVSPLPRYQIALGKLAVGVAYGFLLLFVSMPMFTIAYQLGGVEFSVIAGLYATHALLGIWLVALGLWISSYFERTWSSSMVAVAVPGAAMFVNLALIVATKQDSGPSLTSQWLAVINPGFSLALLFDGAAELEMSVPEAWTSHFLALTSFLVVTMFLLARRLRCLRS
ncbi:MAG: ABC transporter permease subunit [Deltaproteobacteria bacterium]|nr:ABC transporter permease subunit [Deltaproteobacteria bacterium]